MLCFFFDSGFGFEIILHITWSRDILKKIIILFMIYKQNLHKIMLGSMIKQHTYIIINYMY